MVVNLLGMFDDYGSKFKNMVILTTIIACINYCVDNKLQPTIDQVVKYVKEKTGLDVDISIIGFFLDLLMNNLNLFIVFTISESCEDLVRNMLDNPSAILGAVRRFI